MADLFFPQLASGALAHYPIRKTKLVRTVQNILPDGRMILYPDPYGSKISWQLTYTALDSADLYAIQSHYDACLGPYHAFTFIDPTDNMLAWSSDLASEAWLTGPNVGITPGKNDPTAGLNAFDLTNTGQTIATISQTLTVPSNYQYCFSIYVFSSQPSSITLARSGSVASVKNSFAIGPDWARIVSTGRLNDAGTTLSVSIEIAPGQQLRVFAPQLEAQIEASRYRPTLSKGGVYPDAHWVLDQFPVIAEALNSYATSFSIESTV